MRQTTSVRRMNRLLSGRSSTASATAGSVKLGQPVPESNLVSALNSIGAAARAAVVAGVLVVDVLAGERRLGAGLAQHVVLRGRELLAPLLVGLDRPSARSSHAHVLAPRSSSRTPPAARAIVILTFTSSFDQEARATRVTAARDRRATVGTRARASASAPGTSTTSGGRCPARASACCSRRPTRAR